MSPRRFANAGRPQSRRRRAERLARHQPLDLDAVRNGKVLRDLPRLIEARRQAGDVPEPSLVRKYLTIAAHHGYMADLERQAAAIRRGRFESTARYPWLARWAAQHLPEATPEQVAAVAEIPRQEYSADELAEILHVTYAERQRSRLWAFGACDMTRPERLDRSKADKRKKDSDRATVGRRSSRPKTRDGRAASERPAEGLELSSARTARAVARPSPLKGKSSPTFALARPRGDSTEAGLASWCLRRHGITKLVSAPNLRHAFGALTIGPACRNFVATHNIRRTRYEFAPSDREEPLLDVIWSSLNQEVCKLVHAKIRVDRTHRFTEPATYARGTQRISPARYWMKL
jgi:hypothetical protein